MPLAKGYSRKTIYANVNEMIAVGHSPNQALAAAHRAARESYFRAHPDGVLPRWIYPPRGTEARHYYRTAAGWRKLKANPAVTLDASDVNAGQKLYARFVGRGADRSMLIAKPRLPDALVCIGEISVIQYVAERDGEVAEYRHPFKKRSRPKMCVTPDGKMVLMLGGAWRFTQDGYIDR